MAITSLKDGRWIVYYVKGTIATNPTRTREYFGRGASGEAAARARDQELSFLRRRPRRTERGPRVEDLAGAYLQYKYFSPNAIKQLKSRLIANILPFFGHLPANDLTDDTVDQYVHQRRNHYNERHHRQGIKDSTIARELTDLTSILNFAARRHPPMIAFNPIRDYKKPSSDDAIIIPPTTAEVEAILSEASPHLKRCIVIASYTGLRPGAVEMLTLTWRHVLWDTRIIVIHSAAKGGPIKRNVPLHDQFYPILKTWYDTDKDPAGPIVHYHGHPIKQIHSAWTGALKRAGINRRIRPYDLRHRFITQALADGADIKALSEIVGSSPQTLTKHYQHVTRDIHRQTVALIPAIQVPKDKKK